MQAALTEIDDASFLGSAVFSHWRYVTYWPWDGTPTEEDMERFRLALRCLRELA